MSSGNQLDLARLLPLQVARERGAQQRVNDHQRLHERTCLAHQGAQSELRALEQAAHAALALALDGAEAWSGEIRAALEQARFQEALLRAARAKVDSARIEVQQAQAALEDAKRHYALQMLTGHKLRQASFRQDAARSARRAERSARLMDDEFVPGWLVRRRAEQVE
jgi:hypothetical protein